jgi:hypothetical protein
MEQPIAPGTPAMLGSAMAGQMRVVWSILLLAIVAVSAPSQTAPVTSFSTPAAAAAKPATGQAPVIQSGSADAGLVSGGGMPASFRGIALGMGMERVKQLLQADPTYFSYQGDEDVSLLPSKNQSLIEVVGFSYVKRAYFQFYRDKLYAIILSLNAEKIDYYSVYRELADKYGEPPTLSPQDMSWTSDTVRLSLERPLSVKYVDLAAFDAIRNAGSAAKAIEDIGRQDFLNEF